jgi:hypothetical protein
MIRDLEIIKGDLARLPENRVWQTLPGIANSFGNLVLHICGNLNHFIGDQIGGTGYTRNRDAEFSSSDIPGEQLSSEIDSTIDMLREVLAAGRQFPANTTVKIVDSEYSVEEALIYLTNHLAYHVGQANYISRILEQEER